MADRHSIKVWLLLGGLLVLAIAYFGYGRWRHAQLAKALHDPDPVVRMDAVRKASYEDLLNALHDDDPDIRYVAAWRLGSDGSEKIVRALLDLFKDDNFYVRELALKKLRYLSAESRPYLYKGVEDEDARVRAGTAYALVYIPRLGYSAMGSVDPPPRPPGEEKTVAYLMIPLMKDQHVEVRKAAYFCLFSYWLEGEEGQQVVSALEEAPPETDKNARDMADRLLRWIKQRKPERYRYRDEK